MAVSVDNRRTRVRSALAAVLTVLILVPAAILFASVWGTISDKRDSTKLEKQGVEYISALAPLVSSLAEAQSSALSGVSDAPGSLNAAVSAVAAVDQRLGDELGTRDRWTGLSQKIGGLAQVTGDPVAVFQAHVEVTELALALCYTVRNNAELTRDPDNDISHLQQAFGANLPEAVVQVSRMGDLSQLVAAVRSDQKALAQLTPRFGAAVDSANSAVRDLTDNLQRAVDDTNSTTLSSNLVSGLDSFRRGVESLTRGANPGGTPNSATMATAQSQLQTSLSSLAGVVVRETNSLLADRVERLDNRRIEALVLAGVAVLLALTALAVPMIGARRRAEQAAADAARDSAVQARGHDGGYGGHHPYDPVPSYGDEANPTRRERSGALR